MLFRSHPAVAKLRADGAPDNVVRTFARQVERLAAGETGLLPEADIEPVRELPDAETFDAPDPGHAAELLRQTAGLSEALLRAWAEQAPGPLAEVVARWEPAEPHSERFRVVAAWLDPRTADPALRAALGLGSDDRLSDDPGAPSPR